MGLSRLWQGNIKVQPKNSSLVYADDINPIIDKVNELDEAIGSETLSNKVDKITGYSLVADTEIAKIHTHLYGSMFADDSTQTVVIAATETVYPLSGGLSDGGSSGVTFQNSKELKILTAGIYKVDWTSSIYSTTDRVYEGLILINGLEQNNTSNSVRTKENATEYAFGGTGILNLNVNDVVGLGFESESGTGTITVTHTSVTLFKII